MLGHDLDLLRGQWVERGDLLCEIGQDEAKEVIFAFPQQDLEIQAQDSGETSLNASQLFENQAARMITTSDTSNMWSIAFRDVLPSAEWRPPHAALSAHLGGPLPVQMISEARSQTPRWQLLRPHLVGHASLDSQQSLAIRSGELVTIQLDRGRATFGMHLLRVSSEWLHEKVKAAWRMTTRVIPRTKADEYAVCNLKADQ